MGVSSAYLYRFFDSKQAIGEAVCAMTLAKIDVALKEIAERDDSATQRLRDLLDCLLEKGLELFLKERRMHDIVVAIENQWHHMSVHDDIYEAIRRIVADGREAGVRARDAAGRSDQTSRSARPRRCTAIRCCWNSTTRTS